MERKMSVVAFWVAYVAHATFVLNHTESGFWLRLSWLTFIASSFLVLQQAQPTLHWTTREKTANLVWACALLLSFTCLLDVSQATRTTLFFAYSSLQAGSVLYFLAARSFLTLRD